MHIYNLASRFPALVLAVANANIGAGFLYFFYPQTNLANIRCSSKAANVILDINLNTTNMAALQQIYHHVCIRIDDIKEQNEYIINTPLTLDEMVEFIKTRLNCYAKRHQVIIYDIVTNTPGCNNVISLTTFHYRLGEINRPSNSIKVKL